MAFGTMQMVPAAIMKENPTAHMHPLKYGGLMA
jgi:hypothetical protein